MRHGTRGQTTIYLRNIGDFAAVNEVYGAYFPAEPPARATVEVSRFPRKQKSRSISSQSRVSRHRLRSDHHCDDLGLHTLPERNVIIEP